MIRYFEYKRNMSEASDHLTAGNGSARHPVDVAKYADMFSAMGTEARLRIMRLLLSAHPDGMIVGDVQGALGIPGSTLSHHLDKLRQEGLVSVRREGTYLRYLANTEALGDLLGFLYAECCTRNRVVRPQEIVRLETPARKSR
jgi:DNA-binding transcriptional ArsR family regulator